jgi:hypothetical protein
MTAEERQLDLSLISRIAMTSHASASAHRMNATMRRVVALLFSSAAVRLSAFFTVFVPVVSSTFFSTLVIVLFFSSIQTPLISTGFMSNAYHS